MTKYLYTLLFYLLAISHDISQQTLSGTFKSGSNNPIIGATVASSKVNHDRLGLARNIDGNFLINLNESDLYHLDVSYFGYTSYNTIVDLSDESELNLGSKILVESRQLLQSIEIIGRRRQDHNIDYSFSRSKVAFFNKKLSQAISYVT